MPGPFDYSTGVARLKNVAKYDSLYGIHVGDELKKLLDLPATMPFRYLNDALAFAVGECWLGKSSAFRNIVAITLGTGFGSAFVSNGVPVVDGATVPQMGYVYNIPYENGIADDYFSTRWFVNEYARRTGKQVSGVKEIADRYDSDADARDVFEKFGDNLGHFMAPLFKNFDADCLVIGGNIAGAFPLFGASFRKALEVNHQKVEVIISELKESAAMVGCARLLDDNFWRNIEPVVFKLDDSNR
jgi:glucokinase